MTIFAVTMKRWGDDETHHYMIGAFSTHERAVWEGEIEKTWRGGKYEYHIDEFEIDSKENWLGISIDEYSKVGYHEACCPDQKILEVK